MVLVVWLAWEEEEADWQRRGERLEKKNSSQQPISKTRTQNNAGLVCVPDNVSYDFFSRYGADPQVRELTKRMCLFARHCEYILLAAAALTA